jgi:hypothetical protein
VILLGDSLQTEAMGAVSVALSAFSLELIWFLFEKLTQSQDFESSPGLQVSHLGCPDR